MRPVEDRMTKQKVNLKPPCGIVCEPVTNVKAIVLKLFQGRTKTSTTRSHERKDQEDYYTGHHGYVSVHIVEVISETFDPLIVLDEKCQGHQSHENITSRDTEYLHGNPSIINNC